jgi:hypothetical protein
MIPVTFNGNTAYLIDDEPNWDDVVQVDGSVPAMYERGLSGRETRRQTGDTLRLELQFTSLITGDVAVTNLRNSLQALNAQQVLCPFWPAPFAAGTMPIVTADWYVLLDDSGAAPSVQPASALGAGFARTAYPLMVGILAEGPDPTVVHDRCLKVKFHFADKDVYPLAFPQPVLPAGLPSAAATPPPLFPFDANWSTDPMSGGSETDVERRQIGEQRQMATSYYAQRGRRKFTQYFTLQDQDGLNMLGFFAAIGGETNNFWIGASLSEAQLAANVLSTDTALQVDNGANLNTNGFVLLNDNINRVPLAVSGVVGNTWNLTGAVGTAFGADTTRIESLVLGRFDALKISVSFMAPGLATCKVNFKELPWETNAVAGETYGTTMGPLPTTAILFVFTLTTPSGTTTWRYTNFERNLTNGGNTYTSAPMEFDAIMETAKLDRQNLTIKSRNFTGNPLSLLIPFQLEWPLMIQIVEADVTAGTSAAVNLRYLFYGEVGNCTAEPPFLDATCMSLNHIFDRQIPRRLYQRTDNWVLFEPANGMLPNDWLWTGSVLSYTSATSTLIVDNITSTNGATLAANFFAAGYCVISTSGALQARMIGSNAAISGGSITLYLATPLFTAPSVGDTVQMYAGYDMQAATAIAKFSNYGNFGGFPFMPIGNPTVLRIQQPTGGGKK